MSLDKAINMILTLKEKTENDNLKNYLDEIILEIQNFNKIKSCVYVLECENNTYYVGWTENYNKRIYHHFNKKGVVWLNKNRPIKVIEIFENCDKDFEREKTLEYMAKYGILNVRGGPYTQFNLKVSEKLTKRLQKYLTP